MRARVEKVDVLGWNKSKDVGLTYSQRDIVKSQEGSVRGADAGSIEKADQYAVVIGKRVGAGGGVSKLMASVDRI